MSGDESRDAAAYLTALSDQLRANNVELRATITPEWIASLEPWQARVLLADLMVLQDTARKTLADIEKHIADGQGD